MSDISCVCDGDGPEFVSFEGFKVARLWHMCSECGRPIPPGERYHLIEAMWDGSFDRFKTCLHCREALAYTESHIPCVCWMHDNLLEGLRETCQEYNSDCPGLLFGFWRIRARGRRHGREVVKALDLPVFPPPRTKDLRNAQARIRKQG